MHIITQAIDHGHTGMGSEAFQRGVGKSADHDDIDHARNDSRRIFYGLPAAELEQVSLTLGKNRWQTFLRVTLPLARLGLATGLALAWVRALGEFGIVLVIAYFPQGIPVKLLVNLQDIGLGAVYPLLWLFFLIAMPFPLLLGMLSRRGRMAA